MKPLTEIKKLKSLMGKPSFTTREARQCGVHPGVLAYYAKTGLLIRLAHGVYRNPKFESKVDFQWEDLVLTAQTIPNGVICLVSALAIYDLTDEVLREHWIAVPNESKAPKRPKTRIIRMRNTELGKTTFKLGDQKIMIFDRERTIVDSFRYLTKEIAIKALKESLKKRGNQKLNLKKLQRYSKILRFDMAPYLLTVTT